MERNRMAICHELGFPYPPSHDYVLSTLLFMKDDAETSLKLNQLPRANMLYTNCIAAAQLFPGGTPVREEHHKLLCNRSLVLTKMRRFREAEDDAHTALMICPNFLKAYWRVFQAVRGSHDGAKKALPYIVAGLSKALEPNGQGTNRDVFDFLTELCTLIPMTSAAGPSLYPVLLDISTAVQKIEKSLWIKVLQKLSAASSWHSIAMLVIGKHRGPPSVLDGIANGVSCIGVSVGSLLSTVPPLDLKKWAEELATRLIQLGASVDEIGHRMNKPPIHVATEIALATKQTRLLQCVLDAYNNKAEKKNVQNSAGSTALHLLVRSGQASLNHGLTILRLLLQYRLTTMITDRNGKVPLEYLRPNEEAYKILKKATKTVEELRQDLEVVKSGGNDALKAGKLNDALKYYGEGLEISQQSKQLYKEAAILYSNCANVHHRLQKYQDALTNSLAAISCDPSYHKGHWWKGKICVALRSFDDAFLAYIDGCNKASITADVQVSFIQEAVTLLKQVSEEKFMTCYSQLHFLNAELWPQVLGKLSKACEWKVMAYLVLGPDLDESRFDFQVCYDTVDAFCKGVAKSASLKEITMNTVFTYLQENVEDQGEFWLDTLVFAVYSHGGVDALQSLATDDRDRPLHATVRYSLITGSTSLLNEIPVHDATKQGMFEDGWGNSVFHTVAKMRPLPPEHVIETVMDTLLEKGFSSMDRDHNRKIAVEYLDESYPGYLFDMFFQASGGTTIKDINQLKQQGNVFFKQGQYHEASQAYTKAIAVLERHSPHAVSQGLSSRDIAVLYGNRAEVFVKLEQFQRALEDAKKSVSNDGHWYKSHLRVGKALRGQWDHEGAMRAFINAYRDQDIDDPIKTEILLELCEVCPHLYKRFDLKKKLPEFPSGEGHVWARAAYKLISSNKWDLAQIAYYQYTAGGSARRKTFSSSLTPICNLKKLKTYNWGAGLLQYFLECKANRHTITLEQGDSYLHALVRIELVTAGKTIKLLDYALKQFCIGENMDLYRLDSNGNTILHTATSEASRDINTDQRYKIIILLLKNDVDPNIKNRHGKLAIDCLPSSETQAREHLRMAMYGKENMPKVTRVLQRPSSEPRQTPSPRQQEPRELKGCDICDDLHRQAVLCLSKEEIADGYFKLAKIMFQDHNSTRHEKLLKSTIDVFVNKLGESANPEIPNGLMDIPQDFYLQIIEGLAIKGKWRQLDALVRKFRATKGTDKLKAFADNMSVVPVIRDASLRGKEDVKLQIVNNLLSSGATFGSDMGCLAIESALREDHYKVVNKLICEGADTTRLSMTEGDTPIHAALAIVLEKEKVPDLLKYMLNEHQSDPKRFHHLDPEQLDENGDCLFHVIAKTKYNSNVLRVTELLCKRNLSAQYYNKDGKLPVHYITKKNDRRLQYLRLAGAIKPSREQRYNANSPNKRNRPVLDDDDDLQQFTRSNDTEVQQKEVTEVNRALSIFETKRRKISDMIRLLPDSQVSIFQTKVENSDAMKGESLQMTADEGKDLESDNKTSRLMPDSKDTEKENKPTDGEANVNNNSNGVSGDINAGQNEKDEELSSQLSQEDEEESAEFVDAVESMDELSKDVLDSIDDLPSDSVDRTDTTVDVIGNTGTDIEGPTVQNSIDTIDNLLSGLKAKTQETISEVTVEKVDNESDKEKLDQKKGELSEDKDTVVNEISVNATSEMCDDNAETNVQVSERDVGMDNPDNGKVGQQDRVKIEPEEQVEHIEESDSEDELEDEEEFVIEPQVFDNLEWEVECTAEVWKTLRDRHVLQELKRRIVHKIQLLATGNWQPHLCKKLKNVPPNLRLFEAKFSKGSRILWELAIAFSPRCSEAAESRLQVETKQVTQAVRGGRIYSEIIRVWEIVLDHDKIHRTVEKIKRSHDRGEKCIIQKNLKGIRDEVGAMSFAEKRYPRLYAEGEDTLEELQRYKKELQRYFPPASANDTEYHILKFYSFSSILVSHVLHNVETKVDFPFRVTDLEHAIITLKSKAPILLLGRSGTGKTTCCLYRLWSQFHTYWTKAKEADAPLMPRCVEFLFQEVEGVDSQDGASADESESEAEEVDEPSSRARRCSNVDAEEDNDVPDEGNECDHLHQVFITKNSVLCNEVQKNFHELSHADELMGDHVRHEEDNLPARLQDVDDLSYPLFVTSRQLLLMLDASIGAPHFFERKEDGSLKADISGWSDIDGPLSILPLLDEDSDVEEDGEQYVEEEDELEDGDLRQGAKGKKKKVDPRREISYAVFVEEIWPKIRKSMPESYHPSLIWMEIMSFIKGSYEALTKLSGYLQLDEYDKLGRKRAPNFSGQRDIIYTCFKRYEHFKKQHSLFDETDLVHDVFCRLRLMKYRPWVIHQIFVDETQDFTQAELCMLIRLCHNPNDMFLTGDTAQSIMRGIAFRFSDLRSLFYHAKQSMQAMGKTSAIEVPKQVYQLTHNYRSHAGILSLASSILELMVEFFPESFDRLQPDQGLFNGPQPILLESCSFSDLAVLLRGNKRKTSHIEFGAHQAILVVNDAARESIPEELRLGLVLTIYEAKGLEFDDVLLYNFFKDSQANKEWRVVTDYLERMAAHQKSTKSSAENKESLVMIDQELLCQSGRPRPLNFDPNQHKVLNSELKHLYTALTRARVNVWIFDEDQDRRAPMFEFVKARKLVKSLTVSEINEESLSETVFAEKSSPGEWVRRGEDFMKHHLYQVAAKCFGIGQDTDREKVALAHHQALQASRLKDQPRRMREEFLIAADMYLECSKPSKAAVCLQNAREKELAAELFEKLGQFERAADIYRKLKQPIASSRCYEHLGNFNKAIEVLYENENFNMAHDTLHRYQMILQDLRQNRAPIPIQLIENKPAQHYTEEKLSHRAAELYHKYKNKERMLEAVDRFQNVGDQVQFLEKKGYIIEAANMLKKDDQLETAANLLLKYGKLDESLLAARNTLDEAVIANHLLAECRILMYKKKNIEIYQKHLQESLKEAIQLFQTCRNNDGYGQARIFQAELTGSTDSVKEAWKAFQASSPVHNEAGLMDCADWLVSKGNLENVTVLKHVIEGITYVFSMCQALLDTQPTTAKMERVKKLDQYYGLLPCSQETLAVHPMEKPVCMVIVKDLFKNKTYRKQPLVELRTQELRETMVVYLLQRTLGWVDRVTETLNMIRDKGKVCGYYQAGLDCPDLGNIDRPCYCMHKPHSKETFQKLIFTDVIFIEMEGSLQAASQLLKRNLPPSILRLLKSFVEDGERDLNVKFLACKQLWDDIMPAFGHPDLIGGDSLILVRSLQGNDKVVWRFRQYLEERWADALKEQKGSGAEKRLKCKAVRETEVFLLFEFGYHLFGLDHGKIKLMSSPKDEMTRLEEALDNEVLKKDPRDFIRKKSFYTLMIDYDQYDCVFVECLAHRFTDAYGLISRKSQSNPFEAVFKFNKFMMQLSQRKTVTFLPELKHYLFWIEFYTVLAVLTIAKLKSKDFPDFVFVLPSSYLHLVKFVEATLPSHSLPIIDGIEYWKPDYHVHNSDIKLQERLRNYTNTVSGFSQGVRLLQEALRFSHQDPTNYCLVERLLILGMTLVCNVGKAVPVPCEVRLMGSMSYARIPSEGPKRLADVVKMIRKSKGIADVVNALKWLIKERQNGDEVLLVNKWVSNKKQKIESSQLKDELLFSPEFLDPMTIWEMKRIELDLPETTLEVPQIEQEELTEEEIRKGRADKQAEKDRQRGALVITRFFRKVRDRKREMSRGFEEKPAVSEIDQQFAGIKVDNKWCGICGISFAQKLAEDAKLETNVLVGDDKSVLNDMLRAPASPVSSGAEPVSPTSKSFFQDQAKQSGPFQWGKPHTQPMEDPEVIQKKLQEIRQNHIKKQEHLQQCVEFNGFRKKYREVIVPELSRFKGFLKSPGFNLEDKDYREKHYDRHLLEIDRMFSKYALIEREIQMLIKSRLWSQFGRIYQNIKEVETDLRTVGPYVVEVHDRLKKEEEERLASVSASVSAASQQSENWDEDEDDIQQVVEEPQMPARHQKRRRYRGKRRE